jgi:hypothetical protein
MKFPPTPQQPRPELSTGNRHDLDLLPVPASASDGPSGQAANLSRAGRSHSVAPTVPPGTTPLAPPVLPTPLTPSAAFVPARHGG